MKYCKRKICRSCHISVLFKKIIWRKKWQPTPVFLPGKVHGQRSLTGCTPWGYMTEHEGGGRWIDSNKLIELKKKNYKMPFDDKDTRVIMTQTLRCFSWRS